jgi:hypothetical protein
MLTTWSASSGRTAATYLSSKSTPDLGRRHHLHLLPVRLGDRPGDGGDVKLDGNSFERVAEGLGLALEAIGIERLDPETRLSSRK